MFLGIDKYQSIEDVKGLKITRVRGLLQELLNTLGDILSAPVDGIQLCPMFTRTDLSLMFIPSSSKTDTFRLPMTLLYASEIEEAFGALSMECVLLGYSLVRCHTLYLGSVLLFGLPNTLKNCWKGCKVTKAMKPSH
jgi:hypothetical protein